VRATPRTWLLVLLAVVVSGVIAWLEAGDRHADEANARPAAPTETAPDGSYTLDVELE
jgi:hypothetical protein